MKSLRGAHIIVGLLTFAAFVLTGQYMDLAHAHLRGMPDAPRLMFRSAHIYTLYCSLLNLALGSYIRPLIGRAAGRMQTAGSMIVMAVPAPLLVSFFMESQNDPLRRPIAVAGIYLSTFGIALHLLASLMNLRGNDDA